MSGKKKKKTTTTVRSKRGRYPSFSQSGKEQTLEEIYFDAAHPAGFSSPLKLYTAAKEVNHWISLKNVINWLTKQDSYTLHRRRYLRFPERKTVVHGPFIQYQADLMDMQSASSVNDGFRYILTVIDCFSRLAEAVPLYSKSMGEVASALETAFKRMGGPPVKLQTDEGKEFMNHTVKRVLNRLGCTLFNSQSDHKAALVERFNRTLRERMKPFFVKKRKRRYVDALADFIESYNNSKHSALGLKNSKGEVVKIDGKVVHLSPKEVNGSNTKAVYEFQYRDYLNERAKNRKFKTGQTVRISAYKPQLGNKSTGKNFTSELYKIVDVLDTFPPTYTLVSCEDSEVITGAFYEQDLQKVSTKDEQI